MQKELDKHGLDIPVLMDETQLVAEGLGVSKIGEVFLLASGHDRRAVSRPGQQVLRRARSTTCWPVAGQEGEGQRRAAPPSSTSPRRSCHRKTRVSYSKDVAPILAENCARCHREGGIAPFAMNSHAIVKGFSPMIREVVLTKRMPPGQIDPHIGDFKETFTLTPRRAADADSLDRRRAPRRTAPSIR